MPAVAKLIKQGAPVLAKNNRGLTFWDVFEQYIKKWIKFSSKYAINQKSAIDVLKNKYKDYLLERDMDVLQAALSPRKYTRAEKLKMISSECKELLKFSGPR